MIAHRLFINNPNERKEYYIQNKTAFLKKVADYDKKNKTKRLIYIRKYTKDRYKVDINFKLKTILRSRFYKVVVGASKSNSILKLIDISIEEYKVYLESKFKVPMSWDNYGKIWEIDHIIPCSNFDLTDSEQQKKCFHYTNTQPLFKTTDIAKSFGYINEIGNKNKFNKL